MASSLASMGSSQSNPAALRPPLLNLDGPPHDIMNQEDDENPLQNGSPKKKRKRRKKKKHSLSCATPDNCGPAP